MLSMSPCHLFIIYLAFKRHEIPKIFEKEKYTIGNESMQGLLNNEWIKQSRFCMFKPDIYHLKYIPLSNYSKVNI